MPTFIISSLCLKSSLSLEIHIFYVTIIIIHCFVSLLHAFPCLNSYCQKSELLLSESSAFAIIQISELKKKIWIFISLWLTATTHLCFLLLHGSPLHLMYTCLASH
ncbi:unnamed protein product [Brassica oleracea]|uniref:(rape) hypothetical protein n=1 Tax=Brassica napus TaxID=3708 RepID=A0A816J0H8_BRANA|nr:unnamed protein product [Brassica napus]